MSLGSNTTNDKYVFKNDTIVPSAEEHVPLGITINSRLSFYSRLKQLCKKVANKLKILTRIVSCPNPKVRCLIHSSFFTDN